MDLYWFGLITRTLVDSLWVWKPLSDVKGQGKWSTFYQSPGHSHRTLQARNPVPSMENYAWDFNQMNCKLLNRDFKRQNFKRNHLTCDPKTNKDKWVITSPVLNLSQPYLNSRTSTSLRSCRCSNISRRKTGKWCSANLLGTVQLTRMFKEKSVLTSSYSDSLEGIFQNSWLNLTKWPTSWTMTHFNLCLFMSAHRCGYLQPLGNHAVCACVI